MKLSQAEVDRLCRLVAEHASRNADTSVITVCTCDMCSHAYKVLDTVMRPKQKLRG